MLQLFWLKGNLWTWLIESGGGGEAMSERSIQSCIKALRVVGSSHINTVVGIIIIFITVIIYMLRVIKMFSGLTFSNKSHGIRLSKNMHKNNKIILDRLNFNVHTFWFYCYFHMLHIRIIHFHRLKTFECIRHCASAEGMGGVSFFKIYK